VLNTLDNVENFKWIVWPEKFRDLPGNKLVGLGKGLSDDLEKNQSADLKTLKTPAGFTEFNAADLSLFLVTVVKGRLRQYKEFGTTAAVGRELFSGYALPFEAASILLLGAIIGVLVLARKKSPEGAKP
jgi:hypothetical protein